MVKPLLKCVLRSLKIQIIDWQMADVVIFLVLYFYVLSPVSIFFEVSVRPYPGNKPNENYMVTYVLAKTKGKTTFKEGTQLNRRQKNPWVFTYDKPYVGQHYYHFL